MPKKTKKLNKDAYTSKATSISIASGNVFFVFVNISRLALVGAFSTNLPPIVCLFNNTFISFLSSWSKEAYNKSQKHFKSKPRISPSLKYTCHSSFLKIRGKLAGFVVPPEDIQGGGHPFHRAKSMMEKTCALVSAGHAPLSGGIPNR